MPDPSDKLSVGQPVRVRARAWNDMQLAGELARASRLGEGGGGPWRVVVHPANTVLVRNDSGGGLADGRVLAPTAAVGPLGDAPRVFAAAPSLAGDAPSASTDPVVVLVDPADDGGFAVAAVAGLVAARVDFSDASHAFAVVDPGSTLLVSDATAGYPVLAKEAGTGEKWAAVLLGGGAGTGGVPKRVLKDVECSGGSFTPTYVMALCVTMTVTGTVRDADGDPVVGETVTVRLAGGGATQATDTTDGDGEYSIDFVGDSGTLEVTAGGSYTPSATTLTFTSPDPIVADFDGV